MNGWWSLFKVGFCECQLVYLQTNETDLSWISLFEESRYGSVVLFVVGVLNGEIAEDLFILWGYSEFWVAEDEEVLIISDGFFWSFAEIYLVLSQWEKEGFFFRWLLLSKTACIVSSNYGIFGLCDN